MHKILIVDDEEIMRDMLVQMVTEVGYTASSAINGLEAESACDKEHFDLVILDMVMPGLNGKETFLKLRELTPDVRVVFCSGFHREGTNEELLQSGARGFIQKPYSRSAISKVVADAMVPAGDFLS